MSEQIIDGVDYGPLALLVGNWSGDKGTDVSPDDPDEKEEAYYETLHVTPVGDVTNAKNQLLVALHYQQAVYKLADDCMFHNQTGYWSWDAKSGIVMHSLTIPRGLSLLAGGKLESSTVGSMSVHVEADVNSTEWGITQSPFMRDNAKTTGFILDLSISGDTLEYSETTIVDIYGREYRHTDGNSLERQKD